VVVKFVDKKVCAGVVGVFREGEVLILHLLLNCLPRHTSRCARKDRKILKIDGRDYVVFRNPYCKVNFEKGMERDFRQKFLRKDPVKGFFRENTGRREGVILEMRGPEGEEAKLTSTGVCHATEGKLEKVTRKGLSRAPSGFVTKVARS
jgi:hypothetical protein